MSVLKARSANEELPQFRRYVRTAEGDGSAPGDEPLSIRWGTSAWPATRGTWVSDFTTHTVAGFSEFQVKPATPKPFEMKKIMLRGPKEKITCRARITSGTSQQRVPDVIA
jgi:hypothetical protein